MLTTEDMQEIDYEMAQAIVLSGRDDAERYVSESDFYAVERDRDEAHAAGDHDTGEETYWLGGYPMTVQVCYDCEGEC